MLSLLPMNPAAEGEKAFELAQQASQVNKISPVPAAPPASAAPRTSAPLSANIHPSVKNEHPQLGSNLD